MTPPLPRSPGDVAMERKLKQVRDELMSEAAGKVCPDCTYAVMGQTTGICGRHVFWMTENRLRIFRVDATACRDWQPKREEL